jgi:1-acyl-sn-glycerol-3-phosphate acyltransferase
MTEMVWDSHRFLRPERSWVVARRLLRGPITAFSNVRIYGRERVPLTGPVVYAANHQSAYDIFVLGIVSNRQIHYMAKQELFDHPVIGKGMPFTGAFPVRRGEVDRSALTAANEVLQRGGVVGIFIDGTRHHTDAVGEVRAGAALIAGHANAPVVPVYIHGTDRVVDEPRAPISVSFGRPMMIAGRGSKAYRAGAEQIGAELHRLQAFAESADRAGRPKHATPPEPLPVPQETA